MATRGRRAATLTFRRRRRRAWRPAKTPRSDPSEDGGAEAGAGDHDLPELRKLRDLEAKPQVSRFCLSPWWYSNS